MSIYIVIKKDAPSVILGGMYFRNYEEAKTASYKLSGIVTNSAWLARKLGREPLIGLSVFSSTKNKGK